MQQSDSPIPLEPSDSDPPVQPAQGGLNVVELAAQRGIGPMSPRGRRIWHGEARPCVSCGQLVGRSDQACRECGQDLSTAMLDKMRDHSGPWYVHEHVRPFPGVSLDRLIRQIRRGVLTRTTVVRGPATHHQWRFAAETPVLCRHLGCCWVCQVAVQPTDTVCGACGVDLNSGFDADGPPRAAPATPGSTEIQQLTTALCSVPGARRMPGQAGPVRVARLPLPWAILVLFALTLVCVLVAVWFRTGATASKPAVSGSDTSAPAVVVPTPGGSGGEPGTGRDGQEPGP